MSKCSKCLINIKMRINDDPCACNWFMENVLSMIGSKHIDECDEFIEIQKCSPIKNVCVDTNSTPIVFLKDETYVFVKDGDSYHVLNTFLDRSVTLTSESFKGNFKVIEEYK